MSKLFLHIFPDRKVPPSVLMVAVLTILDLVLRRSIIWAWPPKDLRVYVGSLIVSVAFWWSALDLFAALNQMRNPFKFLSYALLLFFSFLLWIPFDIYLHYGTFPTREGALFIANNLKFSLEASLGMLEGQDFLLAIVIASGISFFSFWHRTKSRGKALSRPLAILVACSAAASFANVRPSFPLSAELNSVRFLSRVLSWRRNPPTFFNLAPRHPSKLPKIQPKTSRPYNVLFIIGETLGAQYMRSFGGETESTPNLDRWLERSDVVPLRRLNSNASCTDLSVPSILTGIAPTAPLGRLLGSQSLWNVFKAGGYSTFLFSSHNLKWANLGSFLRDRDVDDYFAGEDLDPNTSDNLGIPDENILARAKKTIIGHHDRTERFFGVIHLNTTHPPYQTRAGLEPFAPTNSPPIHSTTFARYLNSLRYFDEQLGDFLRDLASQPAFKDLIIVFTADHGEAFGQHGIISHCGSFHVEESHVPGFVRVPDSYGDLEENSRQLVRLRSQSDRFSFNVDLFPTITALAHLDFDLSQQLAGRSLVSEAEISDPYVFSNCSEFRHCTMPNFGLYQNGLKFIFDGTRKKWSVFHMASDPKELNDVANAYPNEIQEFAPLIRDNNVLSRISDGRFEGLSN